MILVPIYTNQELDESDRVNDQILIEGFLYYLDLSPLQGSKPLIDKFISENNLTNYISYIPQNPIASVKFINVVGTVNIFGTLYDVRSRKLYDGNSGNEQFSKLVKEIVEISSRLSFSYFGTAFAKRILNTAIPDPTIFERFDYFYQLAFRFPRGKNIDAIITQILNQPNFNTSTCIENQSISKSRMVDSGFTREISKELFFGKISEDHILSKTSLAKRIKKRSARNLFPINIPSIVHFNTFDTVENKFVKFFLEDIRSICLRLKQEAKDESLLNNINRLKRKIDIYLWNPFFKQIGRMNYIPTSSSVLQIKPGYRELYFHYIQSKFGFKSIVDSLINESLSAGLKKISTLYEIWVFFKIAKVLFDGQLIKEEFVGRDIKDGDLIYSLVWTGSCCKLFYNYTFSKKNIGSYSVKLRPDITIEVSNGTKYLFDAKYKFLEKDQTEEDEEILRFIQSEDIHKMHAYLDAIEKAHASIAIYPGDKFIFYEKRSKIKREALDEIEVEGVGAIPLSPMKDNGELDGILHKIIV